MMLGVFFHTSLLLAVVAGILVPEYTYAEPENPNQCLGDGDPKNDFYIKDLEKKLDRVKNIPKEILTLENENKDLLKNIQILSRSLGQRLRLKESDISKQDKKLLELQAELDKKYKDWLFNQNLKTTYKRFALSIDKTSKITQINTKRDSDIKIADDINEVEKKKAKDAMDRKASKLLESYKINVKVVQDNFDLFVKSKFEEIKNVDKNIPSSLVEEFRKVSDAGLAFGNWQKDQMEYLRQATSQTFTREEVEQLSILRQSFESEKQIRQSELNKEVLKLPKLLDKMLNETKDSLQNNIVSEANFFSEKLASIRKTYNDELKKADEEYRRKIAELNSSHSARTKNIQNNSDLSENRVESLAEIKRANIDKKAEDADKTKREDYARKHSDRILSFASKNEKTDSDLERIRLRIAELASKHLKNLKKLTEDLPKEQEKLKFISKWYEESSLFKTTASVCDGSTACESTLHKSSFETATKIISKECITKAIIGKVATNPEILCESANSPRKEKKRNCINNMLADYITWSLNKGITCLSSNGDIDGQVIFEKISNESTFRPFYSYFGGHGIGQTVNGAQHEVLGLRGDRSRSDGRQLLAERMATGGNKSECEIYKTIFDYDKEYAIDKTTKEEQAEKIKNYPEYNQKLFRGGPSNACEFVSLEEGIHRSVLNGLGLYLYYRDGFADIDKDGINDSSADEALSKIGITNTGSNRNPYYQQIKEYFSLAMYGPKGRDDASSRLTSSKQMILTIKDPNGKLIKTLPNKITFVQFKENAIKAIPYLKVIDDAQETIAGSQNKGKRLKCSTESY